MYLFRFSLVKRLDLSQSFVLCFPDEEFGEDHAGETTSGKKEKGPRSSEVVVADEVQLGRDEVGDPPVQQQQHLVSQRNKCYNKTDDQVIRKIL